MTFAICEVPQIQYIYTFHFE